jgi:hypothetical protein
MHHPRRPCPPAERGAAARHNLAVELRDQGRPAEAEAEWRRAVAEQPGFAPAWWGLGELALARRDRALLAEALTRLDGLGAADEARALRARAGAGWA